MGLSIVLQAILVITFGFSIGSALVGDVTLTAIGLMTCLGCVMIIMSRDERGEK